MRLWPTPSLINRHIPQYSWHIPQHSQQQLRWNVSVTDQPHQQLSITEEDTCIQFTERKSTYKLTTHPARHPVTHYTQCHKKWHRCRTLQLRRTSTDFHNFWQKCRRHTHTHTHAHLTDLCPGLPGWAGTSKGKPNLDFTEARDSEWQWHQLGHMQVCTSLQTDNHANTPPIKFFYRPDVLPAAQPTVSKHWRQNGKWHRE